MKAQLAASQQETATLIKNAQVESNKIIEEARKTAKDFADKIQKEAAERATDQMAKAQQAIELEHKKMLAESRSEIARLVVTTTERVLAKKLTEADRASYNETAARELTNV
jgi:F-type H+-transporting ATPase subunit b